MSDIEYASIHAKIMVETLLSVIALTNMHRASGNDEYRKSAAGWLPALDRQMASLREELERVPSPSQAIRQHSQKGEDV